MAESETLRGNAGPRPRQESDDPGATQIAGSSEIAGRSAKPSVPPAPPWPPVTSDSPFGTPPRKTIGFPSGDETVVMSMEPKQAIPLAWLVVVDGPGAPRGKMITLKTETVVGRTQGDLLLSGDHSVSSQHIRVRLEPAEGAPETKMCFVLYDQATTNGTYAGPRETYQEESSRVFRHELKDGDYLLLGETTLVFKQVD